MTDLTPERRAELRRTLDVLIPARYAALTVLTTELLALLDAADERDRLAAVVESLAEWHETKAMKARRFRPEVNGENRVMDKAAEVHEAMAAAQREALR